KILTPREDLVNVGLMACIEDDGVSRGVEDAMKGDRQFHNPKVGPHVPTGACNVDDKETSNFLRQGIELKGGQSPQVAGVPHPLHESAHAPCPPYVQYSYPSLRPRRARDIFPLTLHTLVFRFWAPLALLL